MLDLKFIRENKEKVSAAISQKHDRVDLEQLLRWDETRRKLIAEADALKQERNKASALVPQFKKEGKEVKGELARLKEISDKIGELDSQVREIEVKIDEMLLRVPNIPHPSVPVGDDESANRNALAA